MKAYDITFDITPQDPTCTWSYDPQNKTLVADQAAVTEAGWLGSRGPGISDEQWPRSPHTGLPMQHIFTLHLPEPYRRRGPEYVAVSFFAGDSWEIIQETPPLLLKEHSDTPLTTQLRQYQPHPMFQELHDSLGGVFGLLYLTREEFSARSNGPTNPYREGEQFIILPPHQRTRLFTQWGAAHPTQALGLVYRPDPNAGVPPADDGINGYEDPWDEETGDFRNWADPLFSKCHLGGTALPGQSLPPRLSAYYLEITEMGVLEFGDCGSAQIDLDNNVFGWACG